MVRSLKEKSIFINIGGKNTKATEVYNIDKDQSKKLYNIRILGINIKPINSRIIINRRI